MPNWCDNYFEFRVPTSSSKAFTDFADAFNSKERPEHGLLNVLFPMPKHQPDVNKPNFFFATGGLGKEQQDIYGKNNWYDWSNNFWGTKWDLDLSSISYTIDGDYVYFIGFALSAWSPPVQAFMNSGVEFSLYYCETGMDYFGYADVHSDTTYSCPLDADDFELFVDYELAFEEWLKDSGLPDDFFEKLDVPALFGGYEQEDKPNWFSRCR
jgi:hypothetical protein